MSTTTFNPLTAGGVNPVIPFPFFMEPLTQITPFSYRDGMTYAKMVEGLRLYLNQFIVPSFNEKMDEIIEEFQEGIKNSEDSVIATKEEWHNLFVAFMDDVVAQLQVLNDEAMSNLIENANTQTGSASRLLVRDIVSKYRTINVADYPYNAKGDGVSDDTIPIQSALDDAVYGDTVFIPNGIYKIVELTSTNSGVKIVGGELCATVSDSTMLTVEGDDTTITIKLDGDNKSRQGILVNGGNVKIVDSVINNFSSQVVGSDGIRVVSRGGCEIVSNTISDIYSRPDGIIGNGSGAARAIVVTNPESSLNNIVIKDNDISYITGEEGDAIQILFGLAPFLSGSAVIENNRILNVSRRAIKIQASNCYVGNNKYTHTIGEPQNPSNLIDIIHSNDVVVEGNNLDGKFFGGIVCTGNPARTNNIKIKNNSVTVGSLYGIYVVTYSNANIIGNNVTGGSGQIWINDVIVASIKSNKVSDTTKIGTISISIASNCEEVVAENNIAKGISRTWFIQNASKNAVIAGNINQRSDGLGGCVRGTLAGVGSKYFDNMNTSVVDAVQYVETEGSVGANYGLGGSQIIWMTGDPRLKAPTTYFTSGTIVYARNPSYGNPYGWICGVSGTPGTWYVMGNSA